MREEGCARTFFGGASASRRKGNRSWNIVKTNIKCLFCFLVFWVFFGGGDVKCCNWKVVLCVFYFGVPYSEDQVNQVSSCPETASLWG